MKTLLLTPSPNVRRLFEPVLQSRRQDVTVWTDTVLPDALSAAFPDLALVDLTSPGLDGVEVCRSLRRP